MTCPATSLVSSTPFHASFGKRDECSFISDRPPGHRWCTRYGLSGEGESEMERERARATESERGRYETDDALMFCLAPSFGPRDTPSFACATGVRDGRKQLRWPREPLRKIMTRAQLKSFLCPRWSCQITPFIIINLLGIYWGPLLWIFIRNLKQMQYNL